MCVSCSFDVCFCCCGLLLIVFGVLVLNCFALFVFYFVCVFSFYVCRFLFALVCTCVLLVACVFPPLFCFSFVDAVVACLFGFVMLLVFETCFKPDAFAED